METTRTSEAPRSAPAEGARSTRRAAQADGSLAGDAGPQDAFSSLLAAMGDSAPAVGEVPTQGGVVEADDAAGLVAEQRIPLWLPASGEALVNDLSGLDAQVAPGLQVDATPLGTVNGAGLGAQVFTGARGLGGQALADGIAAGGLLEGALIAQTALMDRSAAISASLDAPSELPTSAQGIAQRPTLGRWAGAAQQRASADLSGALSSATTALKDGLTEKKGAIERAVAQVSNSLQQGASERAGGVVLSPELRRGGGATEVAALAAPALQAVVGALAEMSAQSRQGARTSEGGGSGPVAPAAPMDAGGASFAESLTTAADGSAPAADGAAMSGDPVQAEPVAFWVNQKTQNAELTLDRDGQPVEVRVSLTGNEAHVTFRSDQAQTREALDASLAQLRELLQREGLVLAGVTVGSSGAQGEGGRGAQPGRQGAQQGRVVAAQAEGSDGLVRVRTPGQIGSRGVDVFV